MEKRTSYKDAGVNIEWGDDASKILYQAAKETWKNRRGRLGEMITPYDDFSGVRGMNVTGLPKGSLLNMNFDGVGTKMEIAERFGRHDTIAHDLFAMVCDDAVIRGAEPVLIGSILDLNSLGTDDGFFLEELKQLATGYIEAAAAADVAVVNGEIAELGSRIGGFGGFNYNWGATVLWFARQDRLITGKDVKPGDTIIALQEEGFRSNGLSLARRILLDSHGEEWHRRSPSLAQEILKPSKIYAKAINEMTGGFLGERKAEIHAMAHITGGGIPGKLGRALKPSGQGATLYDLFSPCDAMLQLQEMGNVTDEEAYKTWNMGQGMLIITPEPGKITAIAEKHDIASWEAGEVIEERGITIVSEGVHAEKLHYEIT